MNKKYYVGGILGENLICYAGDRQEAAFKFLRDTGHGPLEINRVISDSVGPLNVHMIGNSNEIERYIDQENVSVQIIAGKYKSKKGVIKKVMDMHYQYVLINGKSNTISNDFLKIISVETTPQRKGF